MSNPSYFLTLVSLLLLIIAVYKAIQWNKLYKERRIVSNKFRLYRVRDNFVYLVTSGLVPENSWTFQTFYHSVNRIVSRQHKFNLINLIRAMQSETAKVESEDFRKTLVAELKENPKETNEAVREFYQAMAFIVIANSWVLRITLKFGAPAVRFWESLARNVRLRQFAEPRVSAYEVYSSSGKALSALC